MSSATPVLVAAGVASLAVWLRAPGAPGELVRSPGRAPGGQVGAHAAAVWRTWHARPAEPAVGELLSALAAELRAGQPTATALVLAGEGLNPDPCPQARRAALMGGDVAVALRADARAPGAVSLRGLAACWEVAEHSGAGLAEAVSRLAEANRATRQARDQLAAEVAAARATARILAALPALGLLIGHWIGAHPVSWLASTWPGRLVLLAGLALELAGLVWLRRIVAAVEAGL